MIDDDDPEEERRSRVREMVDEEGEGWAEGFEPGTFGCHELLDRLSVVMGILDDTILAHKACLREPAWYELAHRGFGAFAELYQSVGAIHLSDEQAGDDQGPSK